MSAIQSINSKKAAPIRKAQKPRQILKETKGRPVQPRNAQGKIVRRDGAKQPYDMSRRKSGVTCRNVKMTDADALTLTNTVGLFVTETKPEEHIHKLFPEEENAVAPVTRADELKKQLADVEKLMAFMNNTVENKHKNCGKTFELLNRKLIQLTNEEVFKL